MMQQITVTVWNGKIKMFTNYPVSGSAENIKAIEKAGQDSRFDIQGSGAKLPPAGCTASRFMKIFKISN